MLLDTFYFFNQFLEMVYISGAFNYVCYRLYQLRTFGGTPTNIHFPAFQVYKIPWMKLITVATRVNHWSYPKWSGLYPSWSWVLRKLIMGVYSLKLLMNTTQVDHRYYPSLLWGLFKCITLTKQVEFDCYPIYQIPAPLVVHG